MVKSIYTLGIIGTCCIVHLVMTAWLGTRLVVSHVVMIMIMQFTGIYNSHGRVHAMDSMVTSNSGNIIADLAY